MEPFISEISIFPFGKSPDGWKPCDGTVLQISQYAALYSLIGTYYGGDGVQTFALPDLRGRVALPNNYGNIPGQKAGVESVTLTGNSIPNHSHTLLASGNPGDQLAPLDNILAATNTVAGEIMPLYAPDSSTPLTGMAGSSITSTGNGQAHNNMQPYLVLNFCIAVKGIYPQRP